jgi:anaerobic ribonucleoside-triphosphate reductase
LTQSTKTPEEIIQAFIGDDDGGIVNDNLRRENSNFIYSLALLRKNIYNQAEEDYLMDHVFPPELVEAYRDGAIYIHDKQLSAYCQSVSCRDVASLGMPSTAANETESEPAQSLEILLRHFSNLVTQMSQQVSGACMLSQMTTIAASYLYDEELRGRVYDDRRLNKLFKSLIYELNKPLRGGAESAFSNITLEFGKPSEEIKDELVFVGDEIRSYKYSDIPQVYFDRINRALIDVMAEGGKNGMPFTFPLITVQIDDDFKFDNPVFVDLLRKMYNWGGCYFENFTTKAFEPGRYTRKNPMIKARDPAVSRSLCCFDGDTLVRTRTNKYGESVKPIKCIVDDPEVETIEVPYQGGWRLVDRVKTDGYKWYEVATSSGARMIVTADHVFPTNKGDVQAKDLIVESNAHPNSFHHLIAKDNTDDTGKCYDFDAVVGLQSLPDRSLPAYCFFVKGGGQPYFELANGIITHNCRLQVPLDVLQRLGGGIFGSSVGNTGAVQVLNLNMNRAFLECGSDMDKMKAYLYVALNLMEDGHMAKRKFIEEHWSLYPTFGAFNSDLKNYFNVFAVTGFHEGLINAGYSGGLLNPAGRALTHELLQYIHEIINNISVRDKVPCGLEAAPAESAAIKMARSDVEWGKQHGRDVFVQGSGDDVFLTSGAMLPFGEEDLLQQIECSAEMQGYFTSGSIQHLFLEDVLSPELISRYIQDIFTKPLNYITITPTLTTCMACGQRIIANDAKNTEICPVCGSDDLATFSRVIGYVKMIARKKLRIADDGAYTGDSNP